MKLKLVVNNPHLNRTDKRAILKLVDSQLACVENKESSKTLQIYEQKLKHMSEEELGSEIISYQEKISKNSTLTLKMINSGIALFSQVIETCNTKELLDTSFYFLNHLRIEKEARDLAQSVG